MKIAACGVLFAPLGSVMAGGELLRRDQEKLDALKGIGPVNGASHHRLRIKTDFFNRLMTSQSSRDRSEKARGY